MGGTQTPFYRGQNRSRDESIHECEMSTNLALNPGFQIPIHLGTYYILRLMGYKDIGALPPGGYNLDRDK